MQERSTQQPDELIAQLQAQIAQLQQENTELRSQLAICQPKIPSPSAETVPSRERSLDPEQFSPDRSSDSTLEHRLLVATATAANALLTIGPFDTAVNTALQILSESLETDRLNVHENFDHPSDRAVKYWRVLYEWNSSDTIRQVDRAEVGQGSYESINDWYERMQQGQSISYLIEEAPELFRSGQLAIGVKATYLVPISVEGCFWGVLGFDDCHEVKRRGDSELAVLKVAADCIGSAIQRQQMQQALLEAEQARSAELAKANEALQQTIDALGGVSDFDEFVPAVLKIVARAFGTTACSYYEHLEEGLIYLRYWFSNDRVLNPMELQLLDPKLYPTLHKLADGFTVAPEHLHGNTARGRTHPVILDHRTMTATPEFHAFAVAQGWDFELNQPLVVDGQAEGAILIYRPAHQPFTEREVALAETLAKPLALALQAQRLATQTREQAVEAAIAREQEQAAQERAAELAKANEALRRSARNIAQNHGINDILPLFLREAIAASGVSAGALLRRVEETEFEFVAILQGDDLINDERLKEHPFYNAVKQVSREDPRGWFRQLAAGEMLWRLADDEQAGPLPESGDWHRPHQQRSVWDIPYKIGDCIAGYLSLAFRTDEGPSQIVTETVTALATQVGLALELTQLAEEAKQAAIAREQEQAAQERAAELAKANDALRQTVDVLADASDLNHFIGHVLRVVAEQFDAPLVEYWKVTDPNIAEIVGWWGHARIHGFGRPHNHPARESGAAVPSYMTADKRFSHRRTHFVTPFDHSVQPAKGEFSDDPATWYAAFGVNLQLNLPLVIGDTCFGVLNFWLPSDRPFTEEQIELGYALAQQVTLAIRLSQLAEEAKQAAIAREQEQAAQERAAELAKANESLRRSLDQLANERHLDSFLAHVLQEAIQILDGAIAQIFLYEPESDTLVSSIGIDRQGEVFPAPGLMQDLPIDRPLPANTTGVWQRLLNSRGAIHFDIDRDAEDFWPGTIEWHRSRGHRGTVCVAMIIGERPLGMLGLAFRGRTEFTAAEFEFVQALGQQATLAIHLTQLADEAKRKAEQAAVLEERNRIARELHDTLAQGFTGIVMQLEGVEIHLIQDLAIVRRRIDRACQLARNSLNEARRSVQALRSPILEASDLATALSRLVEQITTDTTLNVSINVIGTPIPLPTDLENNLLRIAQEALTNICKHANATQVQIGLIFDFQGICLSITDDGQGFDVNRQQRSGFGLIGMHERVERLGGYLTIASQTGQGTQVSATIPYGSRS